MKPRTAAVDALIDTIAAERNVVEYLLFKLITLKLLFVADERRYIEKGSNEVERVIDNLRNAEARRDTALGVVAGEWEIPADELTLARLAREAPTPTGTVFRDLQRSLSVLADEVDAVIDENRRLVASGLGDVHTLLDAVAGSAPGGTYTDTGRKHRTQARPVQLDRTL